MTTTEAVVVERYALIHALRTAIRVYRKDAGGFRDIGNVKKASRFDAYADECAALADALTASVDVITVKDWVKDQTMFVSHPIDGAIYVARHRQRGGFSGVDARGGDGGVCEELAQEVRPAFGGKAGNS